MAIGAAGAKNAGIYAARILSLTDPELQNRLSNFVKQQAETVLESAEL